MKRNLLTIITGGVLLLIFFLILFTFQVRQAEVAVVTLFGKPTHTEDKPGLKFRFPWPIHAVHKFDQRIQNFEDKLDESQTADSFTLVTSVYVGWRISDAQEFLPRFAEGSIPEAERVLEGLIRSAKAAVIGKHQLADFVSTDERQLKFAQIETNILQLVQEQVKAKHYGLELEYLGFKKLEFPPGISQEVFKRMQSERAILISKIQSEGASQATNIITTADNKSAEMLFQADADATRIRALGIKESADSFKVFQQNPELAKFLANLKALELSLGERSTLIFDQYNEPFTLFQNYTTNAAPRK